MLIVHELAEDVELLTEELVGEIHLKNKETMEIKSKKSTFIKTHQ